MNLEQLQKILPSNKHTQEWCDALNAVWPDYEINTIQRQAAFIGECYVESEGFTVLQENLNYQAAGLMKVWPHLFPTLEIANQYAHNPEKIANRAYGNRLGNGTESTGDGWKYRGQGLIQLTGKSNQEQFAQSIDMNLEDVPAYLSTFEGAVKSACFFWKQHNLNSIADTGDIDHISKIINGGTLGLVERKQHYQTALSILGN
jgi:putative chitinase